MTLNIILMCLASLAAGPIAAPLLAKIPAAFAWLGSLVGKPAENEPPVPPPGPDVYVESQLPADLLYEAARLYAKRGDNLKARKVFELATEERQVSPENLL